jgi:hypothetical protein
MARLSQPTRRHETALLTACAHQVDPLNPVNSNQLDLLRQTLGSEQELATQGYASLAFSLAFRTLKVLIRLRRFLMLAVV